MSFDLYLKTGCPESARLVPVGAFTARVTGQCYGVCVCVDIAYVWLVFNSPSLDLRLPESHSLRLLKRLRFSKRCLVAGTQSGKTRPETKTMVPNQPRAYASRIKEQAKETANLRIVIPNDVLCKESRMYQKSKVPSVPGLSKTTGYLHFERKKPQRVE